MRSIVACTALAFAFLAPGCATGHHAAQQASPAPDEAVALDVTNDTWQDVDVYVLASTLRVRVGSVTSQTSAHLTIPSDLLAYGSIQVGADPIGGGTPYRTDLISIHGGQRITLTVEHQLGLSSWVVDDRDRW